MNRVTGATRDCSTLVRRNESRSPSPAVSAYVVRSMPTQSCSLLARWCWSRTTYPARGVKTASSSTLACIGTATARATSTGIRDVNGSDWDAVLAANKDLMDDGTLYVRLPLEPQQFVILG